MDDQERNDLLIRIEARVDQIVKDNERYRVDIIKLFDRIDDINKMQLPSKIESVQEEITEHKTNHWTAYGLVLGIVGVVITLFEVFRSGK